MSINIAHSFDKVEPLMTLQTFKSRYLFGIDLRNANGEELADEVIQSFIDIGSDYISFELNCPINETEYTYYEDYILKNYKSHAFIQVPIYPLIDVTQITLTYGYDESGTDVGLGIEFPKNWYKIYASSGQIHLLPTVATVNSLILRNSGFTMRRLHGDYLPQVLKVEYKAGFGNNVPPLLNHAIGLASSIYLLNQLGDIGPGGAAGISSQSVSLDGMSNSISTAISATNALFGARIEQYQKELNKTVLKNLKKKYKRIALSYI